MLQLHMLQGRLMRRLQDNRWSFPRFSRLLPSGGTDAPTVTGFETRKFIFGPRGGKIVPSHQAELEKVLGHLSTDRMAPEIRLMPLATPRPGETRQRIH